MNRRKNEKGLAIAVIAVLLGAVVPLASTTPTATNVYAQTTPTDLTDEELEVQNELIQVRDASLDTLDVTVDGDDDYSVQTSNVAWIDAETTSAIFVDCPPGQLPQGGFKIASSEELVEVQTMPVGTDGDIASWLSVVDNQHSSERKAVIIGVICEGDTDTDTTVVRSGGDSSNVVNDIDITNINFITEIRNTINIRNNNTTIINNNTNVTIIPPPPGGNDTNGNTTDPGGNTTDPGTGGNTTDPGTGGNTTTLLLTTPLTTEELEDSGITPEGNTTTELAIVDEEELTPTVPEEEVTPPVSEEETPETTPPVEEEETETEEEVEEEETTAEETPATEEETDSTADASGTDGADPVQ